MQEPTDAWVTEQLRAAIRDCALDAAAGVRDRGIAGVSMERPLAIIAAYGAWKEAAGKREVVQPIYEAVMEKKDSHLSAALNAANRTVAIKHQVESEYATRSAALVRLVTEG